MKINMQYENEDNETGSFVVDDVQTGVIIGFVDPDSVTFGELPYYAESIIKSALEDNYKSFKSRIKELIDSKDSAETIEEWKSYHDKLEPYFSKLLEIDTVYCAFSGHDGETSSFDYENFEHLYGDDGRYDYIQKSIEESPPQNLK